MSQTMSKEDETLSTLKLIAEEVMQLRADNARLREALQALLNDADNLEAAREWDEHRELARRTLEKE